MTADRRKAVADKLAAENIYQVDYIRGSVGIMAALPIAYGLLTWFVGDALWSGSPVYATALAVPWAPQSWGTLFIALGVALLVCVRRRHFAMITTVSLISALVFATFMVSFGMEFFDSRNPSTLPPALNGGTLSLLMMNLTRHGIKMRQTNRLYAARTRACNAASCEQDD